jgi:hypothetical protein
MRTAQLKQRLGTVHDNRAFYAWYLTRRNAARSSAKNLTAETRIIEDGKSRATEDGQARVV